MSYTRDDYIAAKALVDASWEALKACPEQTAYEAAMERLDEISEDLGDVMTCEDCNAPVFDDDPYTYDSMNGITLCRDCSPTWQEFQDNPEQFYCGDGDDDFAYHTAETARPLIEAHLAKGGSLSDSMAKRRDEP